MASKYSFALLFLLILLFKTVRSEDTCGFYLCPDCCLDSTKNATVTVVEVGKIVEALWKYPGYEIMPTILEKHLRSVHHYCNEFLFFVDRQNRFTIYGNNTITLFVPPDNAIRFDDWIDLEYQIMMSKVDEEAFKSAALSKGSKLVPLSPTNQRLVVDQVFDNGTVSINTVKIKHWNIYNDGHVIVHGTEDFFNHWLGVKTVSRFYWERPELDLRWLEIFEDPKTGSYTAHKILDEYGEYKHYEVTELTSIKVLL